MRFVTALILFSLLLPGCISTNRLTTRNYSGTINEYAGPFRKTLVHKNDSVSDVIVEINHSELKYLKKKGSNIYKSRYSIAYEIYPDITSNKVSDSNTIILSDSLHFATFDRTIRKIPIAIKDSGVVFVGLSFKDLNGKKTFHHFLEIEKSSSDKWNYLVKNNSGQIQFDNYKKYHEKFRFEYRGNYNVEMQAILYDLNAIAPARAPFTQLELKEPLPSSEHLFPDKGVLNLANKSGLLVIRKKEIEIGGYPFLSVAAPFPKISDAETKIQTLRYITGNDEFLKLKYSDNQKDAYIDFWGKSSGDYDRAYSKMAAYEKNVTYANRFFSLSREGWKTDRGMIYIVFGLPDKVLKHSGQEKWIYHNQRKGTDLEFVFKKEETLTGIEEYYLKRKEEYRIPWYKKVEHWKN